MNNKKVLPKSLPYSDWFGSGDTIKDIQEKIKDNGKPKQIYISENLGCLVYPDKIVICGYDGNEYTFFETFDKEYRIDEVDNV